MAHQIVAIQRDVERAGRDLVPIDPADGQRQAPRQRHAARADADERELLDAAISLEDFVRDPGEGPRHPVGIHHHRHGDTL